MWIRTTGGDLVNTAHLVEIEVEWSGKRWTFTGTTPAGLRVHLGLADESEDEPDPIEYLLKRRIDWAREEVEIFGRSLES